MRIEVTYYPEKKKEKLEVDFEFGDTLINLSFSKADLDKLEKVIKEGREAYADAEQRVSQKDAAVKSA